MDYEDSYEQEVGRMVVAFAVRRPGEDVAWAALPSLAAGQWMTDAVEVAALEARAPSMCGNVFAAPDWGG